MDILKNCNSLGIYNTQLKKYKAMSPPMNSILKKQHV